MPSGMDADEEARAEDGQLYVDRSKIDFDPSEGLLSGTAIDGTSEIPGSEDSALAGESPSRDGTQT